MIRNQADCGHRANRRHVTSRHTCDGVQGSTSQHDLHNEGRGKKKRETKQFEGTGQNPGRMQAQYKCGRSSHVNKLSEQICITQHMFVDHASLATGHT
jgi:hypothetical protein